MAVEHPCQPSFLPEFSETDKFTIIVLLNGELTKPYFKVIVLPKFNKVLD